ncbi:MAG: hybrid sensor histidine kinase/response regulator, partial [Zetaproteobacteria bacterium CG02_land_8_20_14_3_00_50_9]
ILIVDDEKALVDITAELLEKMGYHTLMAHNGLEAIDVFSEHKAEIKAILMDVIMPRCGGVEAAAHIRKENPDVGITFTTGYDQLKAPDVHKINTPDAVLSKPYSVEALGEAISRMIYKDNA